MKTPEQIFDEAIKAKGLDIVSVKDADLYEAGLDAITKALSLGSVVGQIELLQGFFEFYKQKFGGGFNTDVLEITLKQYQETL